MNLYRLVVCIIDNNEDKDICETDFECTENEALKMLNYTITQHFYIAHEQGANNKKHVYNLIDCTNNKTLSQIVLDVKQTNPSIIYDMGLITED